jgi:hypothetical protein
MRANVGAEKLARKCRARKSRYARFMLKMFVLYSVFIRAFIHSVRLYLQKVFIRFQEF